MLNWVKFLLVIWGIAAQTVTANAGMPGSSTALYLDIPSGETAFVVDPTKREIQWDMGTCQRTIGIEKDDKPHKSDLKTITSEVFLDKVTLGNRQVELKQQFRFHLVGSSDTASMEVYNSVRGGWSTVPVVKATSCALHAICRSRAELPPC